MNRYNAGETYKEIGDAYGYHPDAVRAIIRREKKAKTKLDVNAKPSVSKTTAKKKKPVQKKDVPEKTDKKEVKIKTMSAKKKTEKKPTVKAAKPIEKKERKENHRTEPVLSMLTSVFRHRAGRGWRIVTECMLEAVTG